MSGPAPWQKSTKVERWSKASYRKQEEKHEDLIIPKLNKKYKKVKYGHLNEFQGENVIAHGNF